MPVLPVEPLQPVEPVSECFLSVSGNLRSRLRPYKLRLGAMYVSVLFASLIVSVTTLTGLKMLELRIRAHAGGNDAHRARQISDSGLAVALARINQQTDWRSQYKNGVATPAESFNDGRFWFVLENESQDLEKRGDGTITLTVHSRYGQAGHARAAKLVPTYLATEPLKASLYVQGTMATGTGGSVSTDGAVWVRGGTEAPEATNNTNTSNTNTSPPSTQTKGLLGALSQALNHLNSLLQGSGVNAPTNPPAQTPAEPIDTQWIEEYIAIGTEIPYQSLLLGKISGVLLSPNSNPYGSATNEKGVYFVRCGGARIDIQNSRIVGTLVLIDCASNSAVSDSVHWTPAIPEMPALVTAGSVNLQLSVAALDEAAMGANFNPEHTPYRGQANQNMVDRYPSGIYGPILVAGDFNVQNFETGLVSGGVYVFGKLALNSRLAIQRDDRLATNPPPGLRTYKGMRFVNGTIRSVATSH